MHLLFVAALHHPEALAQAVAAADAAGVAPPLFPPSMSQHFWEQALRRRGHRVSVFWRRRPAARARFRRRLTPGAIAGALLRRLPPTLDPNARAVNAALYQQAIADPPDVLWMVGDNDIITPATLLAIKRATGALLVYATGTSPIVFLPPIDRAALTIKHLYDLALVNDYYHGIQLQELGARAMVCLPLSACDPSFHQPAVLDAATRDRLRSDIAFVGTLLPPTLYTARVEALEAVAPIADLGIWSVHDLPPSLARHHRGSALGAEMLPIFAAAKLTINTHGDFVRYGGNMRLFEAAAAGIAQIADDLPGTRRWFPPTAAGETIALYRTPDDLRAHVRHLLDDDAERAALAQRARDHVLAHHTYDHRAADVERAITDLHAGILPPQTAVY